MLKKVFAGFLTIVMLVGLVGCGGTSTEQQSNGSSSQSIVGKWSWSAEDGATIEFTENGTMIVEMGGWTGTGKYKIQGDKLIMEVTENGETATMTYSKLEIDGNNFSMYDDYDDYLVTGHRIQD